MKKLVAIVFVCLLILPAGLNKISAQEETAPSQAPVFDFDKALSDHQYSYNQYRQAHLQYETAKTAYLKFGTLNSKNEALEKAALMLTLRDETIRTFLTAIRLKLAQVTNINDYNLNLFYLKLDEQVVWYLKHAMALKAPEPWRICWSCLEKVKINTAKTASK